MPGRRRAAQDSAGGMGTASPVVDVDRLTDQVLRQLDARLQAFRERFGRI